MADLAHRRACAGNVKIGPPDGANYKFGMPPGTLNIAPDTQGIKFAVRTHTLDSWSGAAENTLGGVMASHPRCRLERSLFPRPACTDPAHNPRPPCARTAFQTPGHVLWPNRDAVQPMCEERVRITVAANHG